VIPAHYVDVELLAGADASDAPAVVLRSLAFLKLHGIFAKHPAEFALALPRRTSGVLRVFASTREALDMLAAALDSDRWFRSYTRLGYPRAVPTDFSGPWVAFARYRIPSVRSDRNAIDGVSALRDRRLAAARQRRLDYFNVHSRSNGSRFSLTVERIEHEGLPQTGTPDSYGLSARSRLFGLPDLD
jgi:CRISPR-associated endoribonuclease Cas6/Csy4 subtype I-F